MVYHSSRQSCATLTFDDLITPGQVAADRDTDRKMMEKKADVAESQGDDVIVESESLTFTEEEERRIVRKIDCVVLPLVSIYFFLTAVIDA